MVGGTAIGLLLHCTFYRSEQIESNESLIGMIFKFSNLSFQIPFKCNFLHLNLD
jgi:hypothetical protein